jgi:hypothetical protein
VGRARARMTSLVNTSSDPRLRRFQPAAAGCVTPARRAPCPEHATCTYLEAECTALWWCLCRVWVVLVVKIPTNVCRAGTVHMTACGNMIVSDWRLCRHRRQQPHHKEPHRHRAASRPTHVHPVQFTALQLRASLHAPRACLPARGAAARYNFGVIARQCTCCLH